MKALIVNNKVVQVEINEFPVVPEFIWVECPDNCQPGWDYINGELIAPVIPGKTIEEKILEFKNALLSYMDRIAQSKLYESALHCASYTSSTIASWKLEAESFVAWRDSVWVYTYAELEKFQNGQRQEITFEEFLPELPAMVWPS